MADAMTTMKNKAADVGNSFNQAANTAADNFKSAAGNVADQARNVADQAKRTAANLSAEGQQAAQQAASYIGQRAEDATDAFGGRLKAAGDAIRQNVPQDGTLGQASSAVAKSLEETGDYIQREGLEGMACDMTNMIKRNPIPSVLLGIGVGFLLAHATKARS